MNKPLLCVFAAGAVTFSSAIFVQDMTNAGVDAQSIANRFIGSGVTITSDITLTASPTSAGFYSDAIVESQGNASMLNGIVLATGHIDSLNSNKNLYDDVTGYTYMPGDDDLTALLPPFEPNSGFPTVTHDATVLSFDFTPTQSGVASFSYVFGSDEYDEWVYEFNDVFAFFLDGENIAIIPGTDTIPVSINNVNYENHSELYNRNDLDYYPNGDVPFETEMDGFTTPLTTEFEVTADQTYNLKLAIADEGDRRFDSWVLLGENSFTVTPDQDTCPHTPTCTCKKHKHQPKHTCSTKHKHQSKHVCSTKHKYPQFFCSTKHKHTPKYTCSSTYKHFSKCGFPFYGQYAFNQQYSCKPPTNVPEPGSASLLILSVALLAMLAVKKRG